MNINSYGWIVKNLSLTSVPTFAPFVSFSIPFPLHFVDDAAGTFQLKFPGLPVRVFIAFHVVPSVVYFNTVFATGRIVLLVSHLIPQVLPDVRVSPPFGDCTISTTIVNGLSEMSSPTFTLLESYPITFTRHVFLLTVTTGTSSQCVQLRPVTVFMKFQLVPLLVEYCRSNFIALLGAFQHIA